MEADNLFVGMAMSVGRDKNCFYMKLCQSSWIKLFLQEAMSGDRNKNCFCMKLCQSAWIKTDSTGSYVSRHG